MIGDTTADDPSAHNDNLRSLWQIGHAALRYFAMSPRSPPRQRPQTATIYHSMTGREKRPLLRGPQQAHPIGSALSRRFGRKTQPPFRSEPHDRAADIGAVGSAVFESVGVDPPSAFRSSRARCGWHPARPPRAREDRNAEGGSTRRSQRPPSHGDVSGAILRLHCERAAAFLRPNRRGRAEAMGAPAAALGEPTSRAQLSLNNKWWRSEAFRGGERGDIANIGEPHNRSAKASASCHVGGGIVGCSVAYDLTIRGCTDVLLLERKQLTCGTTWHAAGLVGPLHSESNAVVRRPQSFPRFPSRAILLASEFLPPPDQSRDHF